MAREIYTPGFAVFNLHINFAGQKANQGFIRIFGQKKFDRHIVPSHADGIMGIFDLPANKYRTAWISMVTVLVNEYRGRITKAMMEADTSLPYKEGS